MLVFSIILVAILENKVIIFSKPKRTVSSSIKLSGWYLTSKKGNE